MMLPSCKYTTIKLVFRRTTSRLQEHPRHVRQTVRSKVLCLCYLPEGRALKRYNSKGNEH